MTRQQVTKPDVCTGVSLVTQKQVFIFKLSSIPETLDSEIVVPSGCSVFIGADFTKFSTAQCEALVNWLVDHKILYLSAWGNGAESFHDQFDADLANSKGDSSSILTTWHSIEKIEDALEFFLFTAVPAEEVHDRWRGQVVLLIGASDSAERANAWLNANVKFNGCDSKC